MSAPADLSPERRANRTSERAGSFLSLVRHDARALLIHPAALACTLLAVATWAVPALTDGHAADFPDLTSASWTVQYRALIMAAGVYTAAALLTVRPVLNGTAEFESSLGMPVQRRVLATLLASLAPATLALASAVAELAVAASRTGASGSVLPVEVVTVVPLIALAAALGVAVGRATGSSAWAFLLLVALVVIGFLGLALGDSPRRFLCLVAGEDPFSMPPIPHDLVARPAAWHLVWLAGLIGAAAAVALLRVTLCRKPVVALAIGSAAVLVIGAAMQLRPASADLIARRAAADVVSRDRQVCRTFGDDTYCAFPDFASFLPAWRSVVAGQRDIVGGKTAVRSLLVRQHLPLPVSDQGVPQPLPLAPWAVGDQAAPGLLVVPASTRWGAPGSDSFGQQDVIGFSALVAKVLVTGEAPTPEAKATCGARGAVTLWLAAAANEETASALRTVLAHTSGGAGIRLSVLNSQGGVFVGSREQALTLAMLAQNLQQIRQKVMSSWDRLVAPGTTVDAAAAALAISISAPPPPPGSLCS